MQIELSEANEKLVEEYRKQMQAKFPGYDASATSIVNAAAGVWLIKETKKTKATKKA